MERIARYVAIISAAVLVGYSTLQMFGPDGEILERAPPHVPLLLMFGLTSVGTLLGRVPGAFAIAIYAGFVGASVSLTALVLGSGAHGAIVECGNMAASLVTLASGLVLRAAHAQRTAGGE
jgi:hypothetical protein